jgi:hypothetical protein
MLVVEMLGVGLVGESKSLEEPFHGLAGALSFILLPLPHHEVSNLPPPCPSAMMYCLATSLKLAQPRDHGLKLLKL